MKNKINTICKKYKNWYKIIIMFNKNNEIKLLLNKTDNLYDKINEYFNNIDNYITILENQNIWINNVNINWLKKEVWQKLLMQDIKNNVLNKLEKIIIK